jgi:hypothetical protein
MVAVLVHDGSSDSVLFEQPAMTPFQVSGRFDRNKIRRRDGNQLPTADKVAGVASRPFPPGDVERKGQGVRQRQVMR